MHGAGGCSHEGELSHAPVVFTDRANELRARTAGQCQTDQAWWRASPRSGRARRPAALSNDELQARSLPAFQKLALWALRDARDPPRLFASFDFWGATMAEAGRTRSGQEALSVLFEYMFQVLDRVHWSELHARIRSLESLTEETTMTIAEMFREEGREQGRVATLRKLLVLKFQALDAASEARLQAATPEEVDRYLDRLLTADSLSAVFDA